MTSKLFGNPHSLGSASSQTSSMCCDNVRLKVLRLFGADPAAFDVVFVANATAGIKLVAEAMACQPHGGFRYWYHRDSHTSLVGVREMAMQGVSCLEDDAAVEDWICSGTERGSGDEVCGLFAYPAQSNMNGRRLPLSWCGSIRSTNGGICTLLDAAGLVSTSPLDLSDIQTAPDFTVMSFYKMFGFPDLGALIIKKDAGRIFEARRYFGGGTVETVACGGNHEWHFKKDTTLHESLEDGTLPISSIRALDLAIDNHERLFGSFSDISRHTGFLVSTAYTQLEALRHSNGSPVCTIYNDRTDMDNRGPVIALNLLDASGDYVSLQEVQKLASINNVHLRTGNLCNPGGVSHALGMDAKDLMENYSVGLRCSSDRDILNGKPTGVVRLSFGAMSTLADVNQFLTFVKDSFVENTPIDNEDSMVMDHDTNTNFCITSLVVYPIKSCGGYLVPPDTPWMVRSEGLAWDREWCLVHQGTQVALNQKRFPMLALFKPQLDLPQNLLHVQWIGTTTDKVSNTISIPLTLDIRLFREASVASVLSCARTSCTERARPLIYSALEITNFFSAHLDMPVYLARLPPKNHLPLSDEKGILACHFVSGENPQDMPGSFPTPPPSPLRFQSEDELETRQSPGSLANESPILVLFLPSLDRVNALLPEKTEQISPESFRGNIVLGALDVHRKQTDEMSKTLPLRLIEDGLTTLEIYNESSMAWKQPFKLNLMAPCRRCQMVAIDQNTAMRKPEVFAHIAKVRRSNGGVWFGVHAAVDKDDNDYRHELGLVVRVGDRVRGS